MTEIERIKIVVKTLIGLGVEKTQEGIGKLMGYSNKSSFSQVLNGKVPISKDFIDKLCNLDSRISREWVINGSGNVFATENENNKQVYIQEKETKLDLLKEPGSNYNTESKRNEIPLIPIEAMAGYGTGSVQVMEYETENFMIPTFKGADYLIGVRGSSMYPKYNSGDIVACKHLTLDTFFQWNKVYVLDTIQGPLIKRIRKGSDDDHILIISDNEKYEPFELHIDEINAIAIVMGVIRLE